ncbi:MAG: DNA/RNA non-specific endonuclease, partial [Gelidibacter sp.]
MNKRNLYSLIAVLLIIGVYSYEAFLNEATTSELITEGQRVKPATSLFLLPASTTGQVIHHQGYS